MPVPIPDSARVNVSPEDAAALLHAAQSLPLYDNKEFYDLDLQALVHRRIRECCPDRFDRLVNQTRERIRRRPYCALVSGLEFDEGNRPSAALLHNLDPAGLDARSCRRSERRCNRADCCRDPHG